MNQEKELVLVLAGNVKQFAAYRQSLPEIWQERVHYARDDRSIRGRRFEDAVIIGTFWVDKKGAKELYDLAFHSLTQKALARRHDKPNLLH